MESAISKGLGRQGVGLVTLCVLALVVGSVTGVGAIALRALIGLIHNVFFFGEFSTFYDANQPTPPSPWGPFIILAPVIGGLGVVWLVKNFAPEAKGHGVPEVMYAIYYRDGRIRPSVALIKSLASALSIGSGASVGREGPIIQIGSTIGSALGQLLRLPNWQMITMVAAGAGAGIAATFNTPLGAVMFALEIMLPEVSARTFLPVVLATGTATFVGQMFFGIAPAFIVPATSHQELLFPTPAPFLPIYVILGLLCGLASTLFVRMLYWMEDRFDEIPGGEYVRAIIGMGTVGVLMYVLFLSFGQYHTEGVGYATIQSVLRGDLTLPWLLALLFVAKLVATTVSMGGGASGGIFSPSLFLGATLGGAFGSALNLLWPAVGFNPILFAIIGMGAVVGGTTGAAMTAIFMIFEMTGDYGTIVPVIIAVAVSIGLRRALLDENIYTLKLARRGHPIPKVRHTNMFLVRPVTEAATPIVGSDSEPGTEGFRVAVRGRRIVGIVPPGGGRTIRRFIVARDDDILHNVMKRMSRRDAAAALVVKGKGVPREENVVGVITRDGIADTILKHFGE